MDLPAHNLEVLVRRMLLPGTQLSRATLAALQACCSEFLAVAVGAAEELARADGRKLITSEDILEALASLDLDHYSPSLRLFLAKLQFPGPSLIF